MLGDPGSAGPGTKRNMELLVISVNWEIISPSNLKCSFNLAAYPGSPMLDKKLPQNTKAVGGIELYPLNNLLNLSITDNLSNQTSERKTNIASGLLASMSASTVLVLRLVSLGPPKKLMLPK